MKVSKWLAATLFAVSMVSTAGDEMPWAFNSAPGEGYAIKLVSAEPAPGTPLVRGSSVTIRINATYTMSVAAEGSVFLVLQDEKNRPVKATRDPQEVKATNAGGAITMSATIAEIPKAKELRVFVPLSPQGMNETTGEIVIRYPIVKK